MFFIKRALKFLVITILILSISSSFVYGKEDDGRELTDKERMEEKAKSRYEKMKEFTDTQIDSITESQKMIDVDYFDDNSPEEFFDRAGYKLLVIGYSLVDMLTKFIFPFWFFTFVTGILIFIFVKKTKKLKVFGLSLAIFGTVVSLIVNYWPLLYAFMTS